MQTALRIPFAQRREALQSILSRRHYVFAPKVCNCAGGCAARGLPAVSRELLDSAWRWSCVVQTCASGGAGKHGARLESDDLAPAMHARCEDCTWPQLNMCTCVQCEASTQSSRINVAQALMLNACRC